MGGQVGGRFCDGRRANRAGFKGRPVGPYCPSLPRFGDGRVRSSRCVSRSDSELPQLLGKPGSGKRLDEVVLVARIEIRQLVAVGGERSQ
jgi:hypothetical protein